MTSSLTRSPADRWTQVRRVKSSIPVDEIHGGHSVAPPAALVDVVRMTPEELANGQPVTILPAETVLTPAEAAQLLGLSRPFVVRLLGDGEIPSQRLPQSRPRPVQLSCVVEFSARREQRREGRRRVSGAVAEAGLPD
jgi:excisionase family DNA binding protein